MPKKNFKNMFDPPKSNVQFSEGQKSKGILDDFPIRTNIDTTEGTIQDLPVDEKDIANKEYVDSVVSKQIVELFLTADASGDVGGYFDLVVDVDTSAEQTIAQTITANSTTLIASFASILNEDEVDAIRLLESGIYGLHIHAEAAVAKGMRLYFEFYHRTSGGTETLLGTSHDTGILTTAEEQYEVHASITNDTAFVSGDRIVIKVYGRNDNAANRSVTIHMEGDTAARIEFPGFIPPSAPAGGGDVTAAANLTDNTVVLGDGGAKGVKSSAVTDTELETLTDNSMADTLHRHSELSASDGTPDQALTVDAMGRVNITYDLIVDSDLLFVDVAPGYVGIGTNTPGEMLDVVGNAEINGNIIVTGTVDGVDIAARDHAESHTVASHNDTTGTGPELNTLTDNSMADALHRHSELSASDGTPDRALIVDAAGKVGIGTTTLNQQFTIKGTNAQISIEESNTEFVRIGVEATTGDMTIGWYLVDDLHLGVFGSPTDVTVSSKMMIEGSTGNVGIGRTNPKSRLAVFGLPTYANNAAATTGGLLDGDFYKTAGDPHLVCVVEAAG
ncbi:hypothetical protein LCGC14_0851940 [marine sediment metagenome]|uniref:Uncharacterized protein n=1 Tax=marine sediment metagenome TaxID=412755 RepID=A0A0F9PVB0_9ZZZZ